MPIDVILDTDIATDIDDCLALSLILASPELNLRGIACVYGDVDLRARYATKLLRLRGITDLPVTAGVRNPLLNKRPIYWGGHEGSGLLTPDDTNIPYSSEHAVDYIIRMAYENPGQIHLIGIAPLTNIATALIREPKLPLKHITLMGGVIRGPGRLDLPYSEHNIVSDPDAAHVVFSSKIPTTLIPLDLTTQVRLNADGVRRIRAGGSAYQVAVADQVEAYPFYQAYRWTLLHDPLAVASIIDPTLVRTERVQVDVELRGEHTLGATLMRLDPQGWGNVAVEVDVPRFEEFFVRRLEAM